MYEWHDNEVNDIIGSFGEKSYHPMIIASLNINGVGTIPNKKLVRELRYKNKFNFVGLQEPKSS